MHSKANSFELYALIGVDDSICGIFSRHHNFSDEFRFAFCTHTHTHEYASTLSELQIKYCEILTFRVNRSVWISSAACDWPRILMVCTIFVLILSMWISEFVNSIWKKNCVRSICVPKTTFFPSILRKMTICLRIDCRQLLEYSLPRPATDLYLTPTFLQQRVSTDTHTQKKRERINPFGNWTFCHSFIHSLIHSHSPNRLNESKFTLNGFLNEINC